MAGARADLFLVEHGYAKSRAEAQAAIRAGLVRVDGRALSKPSQIIDTGVIDYEKAHPYVSRGALKLLSALDHFALSPNGLNCADIGASTGGFTEVLLERGAARVYAVDVGHGQIDQTLRDDERVVVLEHLNARELSAAHIVVAPQAIVADVSFISLKLALPPVLEMAAAGAWLVALVKPQFEAGRAHIGKGGIISDTTVVNQVLADLADWIPSVPGWSIIGTMPSPILGGDGNREFLLSARKA